MNLRNQEHEALSQIATRWWGGPDEGEETVVTLRFRRPTTRNDTDTLELFAEIMEELNGGYSSRVAIMDPTDPAIPGALA